MLIRTSTPRVATGAAITLAAMTGGIALAGGPGDYSIIEIDPPAMPSDSRATDLNADGQIIGQDLSVVDWYGTAVRITDGTMLDLHPGEPFTFSTAFDINASGDVAVRGSLPPQGDGAFTSYIFRYTDDAGLVGLDIQSLGGAYAVQGAYSNVLKINDAGDLAGAWDGGVFGGGHQAFVHTEADGWIDLAPMLPDNPAGEARFIDLNEQREVLVRRGVLSPIFRYSIENGSLIELVALTDIAADAVDMNDVGQITGHGSFDGGDAAFRYSPDGTVENLDPNHEFAFSYGSMIANNGDVVGRLSDDFFYWSESGGMQSLNIDLLADEASPGQLSAFNEHGEIAGTIGMQMYQVAGFFFSPETGPVLVQDLIDPDGDEYEDATIAFIDDDGRMIVNATRLSDGMLIPLLLTPDPGVEGDLTGDGTVNVLDLLALLSAWGPCADCTEDLNDDGGVDVMDLLMLLQNWSA
jgi:hypothetical protein